MAGKFKGTTNLDDIFEPRDPGDSSVPNTGHIVGGQDLADRYAPVEVGDYANVTGHKKGTSDLNQYFAAIGSRLSVTLSSATRNCTTGSVDGCCTESATLSASASGGDGNYSYSYQIVACNTFGTPSCNILSTSGNEVTVEAQACIDDDPSITEGQGIADVEVTVTDGNGHTASGIGRLTVNVSYDESSPSPSPSPDPSPDPSPSPSPSPGDPAPDPSPIQ